MPQESNNLYKTVNDVPHLLNPSDGQYYPILDERKRFADNGASDCVSPEAEAFEKEFDALVASDRKIADLCRYGIFYKDSYQHDFRTGTVVATDIICPQVAGGDFKSVLFLSAGNRASQSAVPLLTYLGQGGFTLTLRDCSQSKTVNIGPDKTLHDYLTEKQIEGCARQVISIQSQTFLKDLSHGNKWINLFYLYNYKENAYSLIYSSEYDSSEDEQKAGDVCSWGTFVYSFTPYSFHTNPLGFYNTYLQEQDEHGVWSQYHLLKPDISDIHQYPGVEVDLAFQHPNYSFALN